MPFAHIMHDQNDYWFFKNDDKNKRYFELLKLQDGSMFQDKLKASFKSGASGSWKLKILSWD